MLQPEVESTKVLCLAQVVSPEDLIDDADYEDILEDMCAEAAKFGKNYASIGDYRSILRLSSLDSKF